MSHTQMLALSWQLTTSSTGFNTGELFVPPANFKRPIVMLGPLNDIAMEKLARELPDEYEVAGGFLSFDTFLQYTFFLFFV